MAAIFARRPEPAELRGRSWWFWMWVWLPAAIAVAVVARESTPTFGAANTSSWLRPIFERMFGHVSDDAWAMGHHIFRKSGHFLGYGTLGLTFFRAWLYTLARSAVTRWRLRGFLLGVLSTFVVASADEWHQTFLPNRTGAFSDVLLDTLGAVVVCGVVLGWGLWRARRLRT